MDAKSLLKDLFETRTVYDEHNNPHVLDSNIDEQEGKFLEGLIKGQKSFNTIEIGCAMGISSLYICSTLEELSVKHHTIIDPMQSSDWGNIGKANLDRAGIDFYEIIEQPSELALPALLTQQKQYDFGFIDGWHTFDHTLIDFFYLNRLVKVGGIIVIDDISFAGIKKLMRYLLNYPAYEWIGTANNNAKKGLKRYLYEDTIPSVFNAVSKLFPPKMRPKLFADNVLEPKKNKILDGSMIAFRKISEDNRRWDWFVDF